MKNEAFPSDPRTDVRSRTLALAIGFFALIAALIGIDVAGDYRAGTEARHLLVEVVVMALALVGVVLLRRQLSHAERRLQRLSIDLAAARREAEQFRQEAHDALRGLGDAIDRQFARWNLTTAEREVALLLLKGLTHREIAETRTTTETTIRQQALAVYRKSGLRSRADLSAFFLEDLLLPVAQR